MTIDLKIAAIAAVACIACAPASALSSLDVQTGGIYDYAEISSSGSPSVNVVGGRFRLTGVSDSGSFDFDAFCVDLARSISVGFDSQAAVDYHYVVTPLTTDGFGNPLTALQIGSVKGLATLGFGLAGTPGSANDIAAIQGAIWQVLHPGATFSSSNAAVNALIGSYVALAPTLKGNARFIASVDANPAQGLLIPGVPEPATWAFMIAGFGLVGAAARRRAPKLARVSA
jgi:hypothetical protein